MQFSTGIAISEEFNGIYVGAVTWHTHMPPTFATRGLTFEYVKEHTLASLVVLNTDLRTAVNAACNRTIEQLLIARLIIPGNRPQMQLLVKPTLAKEHFMIPSERTKAHWLLRAADVTVTSWVRGER